jgi:hypothetical protein
MVWLSLRQQRMEAVITAALLAALAALLIPVGVHMAGIYDDGGLSGCVGRDTPTCALAMSAFGSRFETIGGLFDWFQFLPAIFGALLAAPLVLDLERGTFRLAWTQSVPRRRWLAVRLAVIAASALAASLVMTALLTWWRHPLDQLEGRMDPSVFSNEGVVPFAYMLFGAALVLVLGVALRRAAPAIGLGVIGFFVVRLAVQQMLRPHLEAPLTRTWPLNGTDPNLPGAWILDHGAVDGAGNGLSPAILLRLCAPAGGASYRTAPGTSAHVKGFDPACAAQHGIQMHVVFQPGSRFWAFQAIEAALFLGLAAALAGGAAYWIARRVS